MLTEEDQGPDHPNRPLYHRPKGEVGICLDVYDAEPVNPKDYSTRRYMIATMMDRLYDHLIHLSLDVIKGGFERRGALEGVILRKFNQGIILSVGFDSIDAHDALWSHYRADKLGAQLQEILVTPELLKKMGVKSLQIRTRMWKDEEADCREEIQDGHILKVSFKEKGNHIDMIHKIRAFQRSDLADLVAESKDGLRVLDENLSHILMVLKRNVSQDTEMISSYKHLLQIIKIIKDRKNVEVDSLDQYVKLHGELDKVLATLEENICHPLAQIPASCESPSQRDQKAAMIDKCKQGRAMLEPLYDLKTTRHVDWLCKILQKERELFGGIVSVMAICVDCIVDTDQLLDEYLSTLPLDL